MNDLEFLRACDALYEDVERALLHDARQGRASVFVAAVVLTPASGGRSIVAAHEETGDGEGVARASELVTRARPQLEPGEGLGLELLELTLRRDGSWSCAACGKPPSARHAPDDVLSAPGVQRRLRTARRSQSEVRMFVAVLVSPAGQRRIALAHCGRGDGEARRATADFVRRVRRLRLLEPGEALDRSLVSLCLTHAGWAARAKPAPLSARPRKR